MKLLALFVAGLLALATLPIQAADTYTFDPAHTTIGFKIRHLFSSVEGHFNTFTGTIVYDEAAPEKSTVDVTIKTASISTSNDMRDHHLQSPDFFDVAKFPEMTFKSKKVEMKDAKTALVTGDLTMHGVTKEVTVTVNFLGKGKGMDGAMVTGWGATANLNRTEYGLVWNKAIEGTNVVGDDVAIDISVEAHAAK